MTDSVNDSALTPTTLSIPVKSLVDAGGLVEHGVLLPAGEVAVDRLVGGKSWGRYRRGISVRSTYGIAFMIWRGSCSGWAFDVQGELTTPGPPGGEDWFDQSSPRVGEVAGVAVTCGHVAEVLQHGGPGEQGQRFGAGRVGARQEKSG